MLGLALPDGSREELSADHVIAATGYRPNTSRLTFIDEHLRAGVRTVAGTPVVGKDYQSSVPGLYFVGPAVAPTFGVQKNFPNALKLTVYSYTPAWLAGIFLLIPGLSLLTLVGLYGGYLLWLGLPPLMQTPRGKALPYAAAVVLCAFIIEMLIGAVQFTMFGRTR